MVADNPSEPWPMWATETIRIVDPQPAWADLAEGFRGEVQDLLGQWLTSDVRHVGSTAIPGLPAKPVIDLQALSATPATAITTVHDALAAKSWFVVPRQLDQRPWRWFLVRTDPTAQHRLAHYTSCSPASAAGTSSSPSATACAPSLPWPPSTPR